MNEYSKNIHKEIKENLEILSSSLSKLQGQITPDKGDLLQALEHQLQALRDCFYLLEHLD